MKDNDKKERLKVIGIYITFFLIAILGQVFVSCSPRILPPTESENSVRTEIRDRVIHDTAFVEIPMVKEINMTRDTASHLENGYGSSDAIVSGGLLYHSLETKPQKIYVPYEVTVRDTVTNYLRIERGTEIVEVERNFTQWESFQMVLGRILAIVLALMAAVWAVRKFVFKK